MDRRIYKLSFTKTFSIINI